MSKPTYAQLEALTEFLEGHRHLAAGMLRTDDARRKANQLWASAAVRFNNIGGSRREGKGWLKYWVDKKCYLKKQASLRLAAARRAGRVDPVPPASEIDRRLLALLGHHYWQGEQHRTEPFPSQQNKGTAGEASRRLRDAVAPTLTPHDLAAASTSRQRSSTRSSSSSPNHQRSPSPQPSPSRSPYRQRSPNIRLIPDPTLNTFELKFNPEDGPPGRKGRRQSRTSVLGDEVFASLRSTEERRLALNERRLALEERRFAAEQESANQRVSLERQRLALKEQRLALEEQRCAAELEGVTRRLNLEQQRLALEEQRVAAEREGAARRDTLEADIAASLARIAEGLLNRWR